MKEIIDKIIEEFEKEKEYHKRLMDYEQKYGTVTEEFQHREAISVLEKEEKFVKNLYAGCKNDWIPCSDRLPEESGWYCVTIEDTEAGTREEQTTWFAHKDDYDIDESEWRQLCECERVVAWKKANPYMGE